MKRTLILSEKIEGELGDVINAPSSSATLPTVEEIRIMLLEGYAALALLANGDKGVIILSQQMKQMYGRLSGNV